jgi:hypothetical protein
MDMDSGMNGQLERRRRPRGRALAMLGAAFACAFLLAACTAEDALRPSIDIGSSTASTMRASTLPASTMPASTRAVMFGYPAPERPEFNPVPEAELACRKRLERLGVTFVDLPRIDDGGGCGIEYPVKVSGLPGGVQLKPAATLNCAMAETFARWTEDELTPAARLRYFSGVATIHQGSSYSCRAIGNRRGGRLSEHASGNAIDVMSVTLKNGREIDVRRPGLFAFRERGLLQSVRGDACGYFSTVLGPGYDRAHKDHFHFDLMQRRNGGQACR